MSNSVSPDKADTRQAASYPPLQTDVSPAGYTFQQPMHTLINTHVHNASVHAKASVEMGEYQLSITYMLSFPDAVRLQVINFTLERFPITNAYAPLITTHQRQAPTLLQHFK